MRQLDKIVGESMFDNDLGVDADAAQRSVNPEILKKLENKLLRKKYLYRTDCLGNELNIGDLVFAVGEWGIVTKITGRSAIIISNSNGNNIAINGRNALLIKNPMEYLK